MSKHLLGQTSVALMLRLVSSIRWFKVRLRCTLCVMTGAVSVSATKQPTLQKYRFKQKLHLSSHALLIIQLHRVTSAAISHH